MQKSVGLGQLREQADILRDLSHSFPSFLCSNAPGWLTIAQKCEPRGGLTIVSEFFALLRVSLSPEGSGYGELLT